MTDSKTYGDAYAELIAAGRRILVDLIKQYPEDWTDEDALDNFLDSHVKPYVVPKNGDFAWAIRVVEAKPEIIERENNNTPETLISFLHNAIEEAVEEDLRAEFRPVTDRLCYPDGVPDSLKAPGA